MRRAVVWTIAGCVAVWALARWVVYSYFQLGDTRVYEHAARMIDAGAVPYRDFDVEYPPLATGLFWLARKAPGDYQLAFSMAMLACLLATAIAALVASRRLGLGGRRQALAVGVVAVTPLVLGTLVQTRYDLLLAALLGWTVVTALAERFGWAWTLLAVATAVKLVPVVLVPVLAIWHLRRRGRRAAARGVVGLAAGVGATLVPFLAIAPEPTWRLFSYHLDRPLQIESLGSSIIHAAGLAFRSVHSYGSENIAGSTPDAAATASTLALLVCLTAIAYSFARSLRGVGESGGYALVGALAASVAVAIAFGKVVSPQYLVWLLPVALLIEGRRGWAAAVTLTACMGLTQLVFPLLYSDLVERGASLPVWLLLARNGLLVVLVLLAWPVRGAGRSVGTEQAAARSTRATARGSAPG